MTTPKPAPPPQPQIDPAVVRAHQIAVMQAIGLILGTRFILLLALFGAFIVAMMGAGTWLGLAMLVAYGALTVLPIVALDFHTRKGSGV